MLMKFLILSILLLAVGEAGESYRPVIVPANFSHVISNPYFPLVPGTTAIFSEQYGREKRENKIVVTHETKVVMGVKCVVVRDTVTLEGMLKEDARIYFAQDKQRAVWFFGESAKEFLSFGRVSTVGSWEAGVNGALPGIVMPARPVVGERFRLEYLANVAEDIGQIAALGDAMTVPYGAFTGCVRTREWSMLDSGTSRKWYAKGVGLIRAESTDGEVSTLISVTRK